MGSAFPFDANSYISHKLLFEKSLPAHHVFLFRCTEKQRCPPKSPPLHHCCVDQGNAGSGPLEDQASPVNARGWFGDVSGELQKRDGAGQS